MVEFTREEILEKVAAGEYLKGADLCGAHLKEANLSRANLSGVELTRAKYDADTKWPRDFDPERRW
jgi:uncharacterized protein YjbI with pentapeptide repeats